MSGYDPRSTIVDGQRMPLLPAAVERAIQKAKHHGLNFFVHDEKLHVMDGGQLGRAASAMAARGSRLDPTEQRTWQVSWNTSWRYASEFEVRLWNALGGAA